MKPPKIVSLAVSLAFAALCQSCHNWPKDSYIQGAKSTVNTPWGPSTLEADIVATGTAAKNISLPEIAAPESGKKKQ